MLAHSGHDLSPEPTFKRRADQERRSHRVPVSAPSLRIQMTPVRQSPSLKLV